MMRLLKTAVLCFLLGSPAFAQQPGFPQLMPPNTVYGRSGISTGPGQAIPFSVIIQTLNNTVNTWTAQQNFGPSGTTNFGASINSTGRLFAGNGETNFWPFSPISYISSNPFVYVQDPYGTNAIATYMRSSDWAATYPPNGGANVAQAFTELNFTLADRTASGLFGLWGSYSQFVRTAAALTSVLAFQHEFSLLDLSAASAVEDPYNWNNSTATHQFRIDCGVGTGNPLGVGVPCTSAFEILNNGQTYKIGLVIGYNAIATVASHINAISMPASNEVTWWNSGAPSNTGTGVTSAMTASIFGDSTGLTLSGLGNGVKIVANSISQLDCNITFVNFCTVNASSGLASGAVTNLGASGYLLANGTPTGTSPNIVPNRSASTTGIGAQAAGNISLIVAATEIMRVISTGPQIPTIPTTSTGGGIFICIDNNNNLYKKATCP